MVGKLLHVDTLSALIARVMDERDWTLSTLARRTGIPTSTLHSWKAGVRATGSRGPSPDRLREFAKGTGLTVAEVFEAAGRHVPGALDPDEERQFLHMLRALPEADRKILKATGQAMLDRDTA